MEKEITFIAVYRCPGCDVALEAADDGDADWRRCPRCGRASRPPDDAASPRPKYRSVRTTFHPVGRKGEELLWIGDDRKERRRHGLLMVLATLAAVAVPVLVCLALGREPFEVAMIGIVMAIALVILVRPKTDRR
jgi:hypothetical protein